ncbi:hypothetical protein BN997_01101 [Oceanobacillus oncorhynchi]|uniref:Uncharacterized protein n=1 Tax=Oceanobacillus oncorhynchi TaxID=545501 RepID=A0A0A1ME13_9BACI|nr:hypothetical protein [Oceanobacillus oncorhynchi]CEI81283.1 hypothetical protein BN997_01101 [Oceanobacillus oncorhynchi]
MKITYSILYKNGHEDIVVQPLNDDNFKRIQKINGVIQTSIENNLDGRVTIGDESTDVKTIRLSEVARVHYQFSEE